MTIEIFNYNGTDHQVERPEGMDDAAFGEFLRNTVAPAIDAEALPQSQEYIDALNSAPLPPTGDYPTAGETQYGGLDNTLNSAVQDFRGDVSNFGEYGKGLKTAVSGVTAGALELAKLPFAAVDGANKFFGVPETGATQVFDSALSNVRDYGKVDETASPYLQAATEFASGGGALRTAGDLAAKAEKFAVNPDVAGVNVVGDVLSGVGVEGVKQAGGDGFAQLLAGVLPTIFLRPAVPKKFAPENSVEDALTTDIRNVDGSADAILRNVANAEKNGNLITLEAAAENPIVSKTFSDMLRINPFAAKWANLKNSVAENMGNLSTRIKTGEDFSEASTLYKQAEDTLDGVVKVVDDLENNIISTGAHTKEAASEVGSELLQRVSDVADKTGTELYTRAGVDKIGKVSETVVKSLRKTLNDLTDTSLGEKGGEHFLGSGVKKVDEALSELLGDTVKTVKRKGALGKGDKVAKVRVKGNKIPTVAALKDLRTLAMNESKTITRSRAGGNIRSAKLDKLVRDITNELEKYPQLKEAGDWWKATKNLQSDKAVVKSLSEGGTPSSTFSNIFGGKGSVENIQRLYRHFNTLAPEQKAAFGKTAEHMFDTDLALKLNTKSGATSKQVETWLNGHKAALKELDDKFGTNLEAKYSDLNRAKSAAADATLNFKEVSKAEFAKLRNGEDIGAVVYHAFQNNKLNKLVNEMPTNRLKKAVVQRAVSLALDVGSDSLARPEGLLRNLQNSLPTIYKQLGKEKGKEIKDAVNQLQVLAARNKEKLGSSPRDVSSGMTQAQLEDKLIKTMSAVIGSRLRKTYLSGRILGNYKTNKQLLDFTEQVMYDPKAMKRLAKLAKHKPEDFLFLQRVGLLYPTIKATQAGEQ